MGALLASLTDLIRRTRRCAILPLPRIAWPALTVRPQARGPEAIADVAEQVIDAVVNISTKQRST